MPRIPALSEQIVKIGRRLIVIPLVGDPMGDIDPFAVKKGYSRPGPGKPLQ